MKIYHETKSFLQNSFRAMEASIPSPIRVKYGERWVLRYREEHRCLELAIIQKLARYISGLNASLLLLESGYTQELGAIFRTLDEFQQDIVFLALPIVGGIKITETHKKYLEQFFQEEFDNPESAILSTQKRDLVPRKKILAIIANSAQGGLNPHDQREISRTLSQTYSGYVHGASCHICEMIGGNPPHYFLSGMAGTYRQGEFAYNYWDYAYRGLISLVLTAKALGEVEIVDQGYKFIKHFESITGDTGNGDAEALMKKIKRKAD
ncbi:hypothetical protein [Cellvibrio sp. PSBB006]|uniref:hypothetical protein n=1 Tax=Cellvibrio sp. PSBB006 TaxID=1987723 RepID=UPI000B3B55E6|nr:hypothetical protein [Cellvibrio sp. PSBB006]ARU28686.1 hypothetical protein CBR65_15215 [Cellvibrio sp. PSBB006]